MTLAAELSRLEHAIQAALDRPLSARRAMLAAVLADALVEELFRLDPQAEDVLRFRDALCAGSPALAAVSALASGTGASWIVTESVPIPPEDYPTLDLADFMVSLYNGHSRYRLFVAQGDGSRLPLHRTLLEAFEALAASCRSADRRCGGATALSDVAAASNGSGHAATGGASHPCRDGHARLFP